MKLKAIEKQLIGSSGAEEEVVDEAKLRSKKASELRKHCSPSEEELDDALDSGDAKAALLDLALARQGDEETTAQNDGRAGHAESAPRIPFRHAAAGQGPRWRGGHA